MRVLPPLLYGPKHAYSQPLTGSGTEDSVARATPEMLSTFHRTWFKPNNATLMAVGDITMEELKPRLEAVFGRWAPGTTPVKPAEPGASRTKPTIYILDRPRAEQSILFAGQLVPPKTHADDVPFEAFNDAFGYAFGSRINMNLREDKHWSYGAFSFTFNSRGDRMWVAMAPVQADKTAEAMAELSKEIRSAVGDRPLTAE
ncbi:MAG: insulinase family protein, partial [Acidobacteria bacterium]|nr:insulinase family protein [Acidobacteriota bacterium]